MNNAKIAFGTAELKVVGALHRALEPFVHRADQNRFQLVALRLAAMEPDEFQVFDADEIAVVDCAIAEARRARVPLLVARDLTDPDTAAMHRVVAAFAAAAVD